jgi:hypothetical protein
MKSPNITSGRAVKASAGWIHGVNSVRNPWTLPEDQVKWGQNVTIRGGVAQTRPGFAMRLSLPAGNFQGGIMFNANKQAKASSTTTNLDGVTISQRATIFTVDGNQSQESELSYLVFAVSGKVYYSPFPLTQPADWNDYLLVGMQLDPTIDRVNFVTATQSAQTSTNGDTMLTPSHRIVVVQDGIRQPCVWDGSDKIGVIAKDMPIGYWMAYSGNRLWVANSNVISASDLGNPLGWQERKSGTGRGDFSLPRPVTGMQDYVGQNNDSRLYAFTDRATYSLASGILDRNAWVTTANFQNVLYPTIGCVAGKSICFQAGMMWWYSVGGLVSADVAASSYLSSQVLYKDVEMAKAKRLMSPNVGGICSVSFENYLLVSVPYLETLNSSTMVLDYAAASEWNQNRSPAWAGVWTGIRPIEWTTGVVKSQPKVFAFSVDYGETNDGSYNHVWEAFVPERYDTYLNIDQNGSTTELVSRIYCQMETGLLGDAMDLKQLVYGELDCSQIAGTVDVKVSYRGTKGTYQSILNTRVLAATEKYQYATSYAADDVESLGFLQTQHRRLITESISPNPENKSCESDYLLNVDKAFSLLIEWCGALGIEAVRMYLDPWADKSTGRVTAPETQYCALGEDGSTKLVELSPAPQEEAQNQLSVWLATKTASVSATPCYGQPTAVATATASARSYVSQADADQAALENATNEATIAAQQYRLSNPCGPQP